MFFKYSPKRQQRLEQSTEEINIQRKREGLKEVGVAKVKLLCETRCVERCTTLDDFREMNEVILDCLTAVSNNEANKWSSKTMMVGFGLLCATSTSAFIAAFQVNHCMFEYTVGLRKLLQGSTHDIRQAYEEVTLVKDIFIEISQ